MPAATRTTTRLLEALFDPGAEEMWLEFDRRYRPIIVGFARRIGLSEEDAADIAQDTLTKFIKSYREGQYDRTRGRLRSWIIGIARYRILDQLKANADRKGWRGDSVMGVLPEQNELDEIWDSQRRQAILEAALVELRETSKTSERTIRAFEMLAFENRSASDIAEELGLTLNDVYQAKNRITGRLRTIVERIEQLYDEDG